MNMRSMEEREAIEAILAKRKIEGSLNQKLKRIYTILKLSVPEDVREYCTFHSNMNNREGNVKMKIHNYRAFLLPYEKNKIQIIYPSDKIDSLADIFSKDRIKELCDFCKFNTFPCYVLYLKLDEVMKFTERHWECYREACRLAAGAKQTKKVVGTVVIDWNRKL
ncbi:hypothetical protein SH2C18_15680 [Clostridium sediminicola]|uniref:hypothetical protein n=1 Tax=Clostridium sediminicola TaxID=3114879 RepID=UPI0031F22FB5